MWPSFRLTKTESQYNIKYSDPDKKQKPVLHRKYGGNLQLSSIIRRSQFTFQISRRSRVMGFTVCGDISQFLLTFADVSGEQYIANPTPVAGLVCGYNMLPYSDRYNAVPEPATPTSRVLAGATLMPYIFEPNIVLPPNNTLTISATPASTTPPASGVYRIDFTLHVYEFPGFPGSPL